MATIPQIKLIYFDIEGVAEQVRLALLLSGIEFEDKRIKYPEWMDMKPSTPYGNLPLMYLNDDPAPKTQSSAMLHYVASLKPEVGLYPSEKAYEVEEALGIVGDLTRAWMPCLYIGMRPQNFGYPEGYAKTPEGQEKLKSMREEFVKEQLPKFLKFIADYIDAHGDGKFLCGEEPTIADCLAVPTLRNFTRGHIDHVAADCLDVEPRITAYIKRFCALPAIAGRYTTGVF